MKRLPDSGFSSLEFSYSVVFLISMAPTVTLRLLDTIAIGSSSCDELDLEDFLVQPRIWSYISSKDVVSTKYNIISCSKYLG